MEAVIEQADRLRVELYQAVRQDAEAFEGVMAAYKLPRGDEAEKAARSEAIQAATLHAAEVPLAVAGHAVEVLSLVSVVVDKGNKNAVSDAGSAASLARTALTAAGMNVRINLSSLKDPAGTERLTGAISDLEREAAQILAKIQEAITTRGGIPVFTL
jgi:glutamate formiminotransferase/formiminotetrahydrofolate cyclodeaminase